LKIIVGNIYSKIVTSNIDLKKALKKKYSVKVPGYKYTSQYRKGGWDGMKMYFSEKTGKFGTGLLSSILEDLKYINADFEIKDERDLFPLKSYAGLNITYRDYQEELIELALKNRGCIIEAPTGSGKTIVLGGILKALEDKTGLIFFTKKQLLIQTYEWLTKQGFDVGVAFGDGTDIKPITLCTIQSIHKVIDTHVKSSDFIIFDEVHEFSKGKVATSALKAFPKASVRIGMTATVPKDKMARTTLRAFLGPVLSEVDVQGLIGEGFLTPPTVTFHGLSEYSSHEHLNKSYAEIYEECIIDNEERNNKIKDLCKEVVNGKTLLLVKNLRHLEILKDMIPNSLTLEGKDNLGVRKNTIKSFIENDNSVLIGTTIMQTGIDIPEITHLINARGLKSEIATLQALGRALRIHKSKKEVFIHDFSDEVPYLKEHSKKRRTAYKSLKLNIQDER
jgi:superfamily II DNA or RNA helicase